jgi:hypothetical protein
MPLGSARCDDFAMIDARVLDFLSVTVIVGGNSCGILPINGEFYLHDWLILLLVANTYGVRRG